MCWPSIFWKLCHLYSKSWWIGAVVLALHLHKTQKLVFKVCVCVCVLEHRFSHQSMSFSQEADMTGQWLFLRLDWTWQGSANLPQSTGTDRKDKLYCMTVIWERNYAFLIPKPSNFQLHILFFYGQLFWLAVTAMLQSIASWSPCFRVSINEFQSTCMHLLQKTQAPTQQLKQLIYLFINIFWPFGFFFFLTE